MFYAATVEAEDAARAPHVKCVRYKRDAVIEWGHFVDGQFHTETGAVRTAHIKKFAKTAAAARDVEPAEGHLSNGTLAEAEAAAGSAPHQGVQESPQNRSVTKASVPGNARQSTAADLVTADDGADVSLAKRPRHEPIAAHEPPAGAVLGTGVRCLRPAVTVFMPYGCVLWSPFYVYEHHWTLSPR